MNFAWAAVATMMRINIGFDRDSPEDMIQNVLDRDSKR